MHGYMKIPCISKLPIQHNFVSSRSVSYFKDTLPSTNKCALKPSTLLLNSL